jgi:hypothetical protein
MQRLQRGPLLFDVAVPVEVSDLHASDQPDF